MPTLRRKPGQQPATPDTLADLSRPTDDTLPERRMGGEELPDEMQDRPEQNAGYDAAVHGTERLPTQAESDVIDVTADRAGMHVEETIPERARDEIEAGIDDRAERDVIAEVRQRERKDR
jgi:hypothetical protein